MAQDGAGLTGSIPSSLAACQDLLHLDVSANNLTGSLPTLPPAMQYLNVSNNQLQGKLPTLPATMVYIDVNTNKLSGSIADLDQLKKLYYVDMR